jgi:hypothetical protein
MLELLRQQDLELLPSRSFLWSDRQYGPYVRDLIARIACDAVASGRISLRERQRLDDDLEQRAASGRFNFGLVYHRIVAVVRPGRRPRPSEDSCAPGKAVEPGDSAVHRDRGL